MAKALKIFKWLFIIGLVFGLITLVLVFVYVARVTKDLPTVQALSEYNPPVMSRVHAGDGKLISEFRTEARVFVPIETVPTNLQRAFVSSEDKRFYTHKGWDPIGLTRAAISAPGKKLRGRRIGGTSTITQQVAKNFLVGDDYSMRRKIREIAIARRIEKAFTKDEILELYVNDNYFGRGAYGVAAASLNYFGKEMDDLTLGEMTYLALIVKGPSNYELEEPDEKAKALARRRYVLGRMVEDGYVTQDEADAANQEDLVPVDRLQGAEYLAAEYFVEEARKKIQTMYGSEELYNGGLSIRTTLDTSMQLEGRRALRRGLELMDRRHGYRGPLTTFETMSDWRKQLSEFATPQDIGDWRVAVVTDVTEKSAKLGFAETLVEDGEDAPNKDNLTGTLALSDMAWAKKALARGAVGPDLKSVKSVLAQGDVILVQRKPVKDGETLSTEYNLRQIPKANGGLLAMDPHTGRILALIGGYSFEQSQYNRATQAMRQPGSAFKPFVYAAALESGFTPADKILDAPFVIERKDVKCEENQFGALELRGTQDDRDPTAANTSDDSKCERFYKPSNYNAGKFYGLSTLRLGIEKSRNAMTVRLANEIGMAPIMKVGTDFGIYDKVQPELAWALGAGETTLMRLATAYSVMINGGRKVSPRIIDRVQDWDGKTVFSAADVECLNCAQDEYTGGEPPALPDLREQVINPVTAYQTTFMMQGVVENGTGARLQSLERPLGGKTGTTNDSYDNWFMGFSPDLVVGVYVGVDTPEQMGFETGSSSAVPIVKDFLETVLADAPKVPFRIPEGVTLVPVNRSTGEPSFIGAPDYILEAFKPGTEPRLGSLDTTIRLGSGTDTLGFFGTTPELDPLDVDGEDRETEGGETIRDVLEDASAEVGDARRNEAPATDPSKALKSATDGALTGDVGETLGTSPALPLPAEGAADTAPPKDPIADKPKDEPKPEKPVERALDDGLY